MYLYFEYTFYKNLKHKKTEYKNSTIILNQIVIVFLSRKPMVRVVSKLHLELFNFINFKNILIKNLFIKIKSKESIKYKNDFRDKIWEGSWEIPPYIQIR